MKIFTLKSDGTPTLLGFLVGLCYFLAFICWLPVIAAITLIDSGVGALGILAWAALSFSAFVALGNIIEAGKKWERERDIERAARRLGYDL